MHDHDGLHNFMTQKAQETKNEENTKRRNQKIQLKAKNMVGPEYPGEGAVKKLPAGSNF